MTPGKGKDQFPVQRFHESSIDNGKIDALSGKSFGSLQRRGDHRSHSQNSTLCPVSQNLTHADCHRRQGLIERDTESAATRVSERNGAVML
jgi:hypothetical protein